jgi:hypothetical protein
MRDEDKHSHNQYLSFHMVQIPESNKNLANSDNVKRQSFKVRSPANSIWLLPMQCQMNISYSSSYP